MRIAVDAVNLLHDQRGIGRYARALLSRWASDQGEDVQLTLLMPGMWPNLARRRLADAIGSDAFDIRRRADAIDANPDVVWYPWNGMTWLLPLPSIATVHDVWPFESPAEDLRKRRSEQTPFRATASHAAAIVTDSHFSKSEIIKHLSVPPSKIHVVHLGVDVPPQSDAPALLLDGASRYVLFVGESEERKDLVTLQRAMNALPDALRMTTGLVIAGKAGPRLASRGRIDTTKAGGKRASVLRFEPAESILTLVTGEVSDSLLQQLYGGAAAFAFPSRYEGFGLPVLEAMAQGIPVVASDAASVPEVAGDAALYFRAGDWEALGSALARIMSDRALAAQLSAAGLARARTMTWDRCASQTLAVFRDVLEKREL